MDELDGVTTVHSRFYELSSDFYKLQGDHANYYREALRFLGCIDVTQLPKDRQHERAYSLSLAALLGNILPHRLDISEDLIHNIYLYHPNCLLDKFCNTYLFVGEFNSQ